MSKSMRAKSIAMIVALAFVFTTVFAGIGSVAFAAGSNRFGSSTGDRYDTAIAISKAGWTASDDVVLASGQNFPDALVGAALAKQLDAPLLLTRNVALEQRVKDEITRLGAKNVYIMGTDDVVSSAVEKALTDAGCTVTRVGGVDRYATAVEAANKIKALGGSVSKVILARADDYADAVAASATGYPVLFAGNKNAKALNATTKAALTSLGVTSAVIAGQSDVVSTEIENEVKAMGITVTRAGGDNRELTSLEIAKAFAPAAGYAGAVIATGSGYADAFADALAAGPFAAKNGYALFLSGSTLDTSIENYIKASTSIKADKIFAAGGSDVVSDAVLNDAIEAATPAQLAVIGVEATAANTLKVKFNKPVADTSKAVFTVKKGTTPVVMNAPTWNTEKTEATLVKASSNFSAGDYTVTVSGLDDLDPARASATITLQDQTVKTIEFIGNDLVKAADGQSATFRYVVKDQYGTDITKNVSLNAAMSLGAPATLDLNESTGIGTIAYNFAGDVLTKVVVVTLVHPQTGVSATATLNVVAAAKVTNLSFGELKLPSGVARLTTGMEEAGTVPVTVVDQYGNTIKDPTTLNSAIYLVSSDSKVDFAFDSDSDGNPVIKIDTSDLDYATTVVLTAIVPANGDAYTKTFDIAKPAEPYSITLGDISVDVIANGDTVVLPITVKDQFGEELTAAQIAANASAINAMVSGGGSIISDPTVVTDRNSANYGKMTFTAESEGTAMIIAMSKNGTVSTKTVTVKAARKTTDIVAPANISLMQGATTNLKFALYDQYGAKISSPKDNADLTYKVTLNKVSGDDGAVTTTFTLTGNNETLLTSIPVAAAADKTGSYKVTAQLLDATNNKVIGEASVVVTVVKNNQTGLTYSIDAIPTLAGDQNYDETSPYARTVKVTAKDAAGKEYVINPADIIDITSSNSTVAAVDLVSKTVFGQKVTEEKKATITVKLNTLDGIRTVSTEVTVSPDAPRVKELRVLNNSIASANSDTAWIQDNLPSGLSNKLSYTGTASDFTTGVNFYLVAKDQYGVWQDVAAAPIVVNSTNYAPVNAFSIAGGTLKLTAADPTKVTKDKDILATVMLGDGLVQITIHVDAD